MPITDINNGNYIDDPSADSVFENFNQVKGVFQEFDNLKLDADDLNLSLTGVERYDTLAEVNALDPKSTTTQYVVDNDGDNNGYYTWDGVSATVDFNRTLDHGTLSITAFGVVGDGTVEDTAKMQQLLNTRKHIYIPEGNFEFRPLTVTQDGTYIYGGGVSSTLSFTNDSLTGALLDCEDKRVYINGVRFFGGLATSQRSQATSTASRMGIRVDSQRNSIITNCTFDGFPQIGVFVDDPSNRFLERHTITNCTFKNCWRGLDTGLYGEYARYSGLDIVQCYIGLIIRSGNVNVNNCKINKNGIGVFIDGEQANDGHGSLNNSLINHNDVAILATDVVNGFLLTGNQIFEGLIDIQNCTGITITNSFLNFTEYRVTGGGADAGLNHIYNNKMFPSYGNTLTYISGGISMIYNNVYDDGTYFANKESKSVDIKDVDAKVSIRGLGSYPEMPLSSSLTSVTHNIKQTGRGLEVDCNSSARSVLFTVNGVDKFEIDLTSGSITSGGSIDSVVGYKIDGVYGAIGSFTTNDGKTVTVQRGMITTIV